MKRIAAHTVRSTSSTSSAPICPVGASCLRSSLLEQRRGLRNLHQYPHARYKSLVKDAHRFSRNWWLTAGNNHELVSEKGHEREATENFGVYRNDSEHDKYTLFTNNLHDLPPAQRLDAIVELMREKWRVKDGNRGFDKARLLLEALECFSELRLAGRIKVFDELPEPDQDTFLQYVEGCSQFAQSSSHSHPDAVAILLRAAQICDDMRCVEKRDEMIQVADGAVRRMDRAYAFARPRDGIRLKAMSLTEIEGQIRHRQKQTLKEKFKRTPWVLDEAKAKPEFFRGARNVKVYMPPLKKDTFQYKVLQEPHRPEEDLQKAR